MTFLVKKKAKKKKCKCAWMNLQSICTQIMHQHKDSLYLYYRLELLNFTKTVKIKIQGFCLKILILLELAPSIKIKHDCQNKST